MGQGTVRKRSIPAKSSDGHQIGLAGKQRMGMSTHPSVQSSSYRTSGTDNPTRSPRVLG